jgi:hypothetical protein
MFQGFFSVLRYISSLLYFNELSSSSRVGQPIFPLLPHSCPFIFLDLPQYFKASRNKYICIKNKDDVRYMAELVMAVVRTKADVVSALRMKSTLWDKGIEVSGLIINKKEDNGNIPSGFVEEMMQLKILGVLS